MQVAAKTGDFAAVEANKIFLASFQSASSRTPTSSELRPSREEAMQQVRLLEQNIRVAESIIAGLRSDMTQLIAQFRIVEAKLKELEEQLETEKKKSHELDEMQKILVDQTEELEQQLKDAEIVHLAHNDSDFIESSIAPVDEKVWKAQRRIDSSKGSEDNPHIASPSILAQDGPNVVKKIVVNEKLKKKPVAVHHLDRIVDDFKAGNLIRCPVGQCSTCEKIIPGNMVKLGNYTFEVRGRFDCRSTNTCFVVTLETGEQQSMYGFLHVLSNGQRNYAARRVYIDDISSTSLYRRFSSTILARQY